MRHPLRIEVTHVYPLAEIKKSQFERLIDIARWRVRPKFYIPGRTAWSLLHTAVTYENARGLQYRAAKLKGVGVWNPKGHLHSGVQQGKHAVHPIQPTCQEYTSMKRLIHIGVSPEAQFIQVKSNPAPYGGILHERALLEFSNAGTLLEQGVPSVAPLAVIRYSDLRFRGQSMGAVISLSTESSPYRAHLDYNDNRGQHAAKYFRLIYKRLGFTEKIYSPYVQWQAYERLSARVGTLLRGFAEAGLYRYASQLENLQFDLQRNEAFLTDLDSSRKLEDLSPDVRVLQIIRDIASALHKIAWRLHYFVTLDPYPLEKLRAVDPFIALLRGYFPDVSIAISKSVAPLWNLVIPHLFLRKRLRGSMHSWSRSRLRTYEIDRDIFFCLAMASAFELFAKCSLAQRYPSSITSDNLEWKFFHFLGPEKFNFFQWLRHGS